MNANTSMSPEAARAVFPDAMTLREARAVYFARAGFDDKTYVEPWVKLPVGPLFFYLPNLAPRKEAVKVHDLNHIVTGFGTDWSGEFQMSAFEIGMGTGRYWFGWFIDVGGLAAGLVSAPTATLRAFARGRRTRESIYRIVDRWDDAVLDGTVGALRARMQAPDDAVATTTERWAAIGWALVGATLHVGVPLALVVAAGAALYAWL